MNDYFKLRSIYPNLEGVSSLDRTIPDPDEQQSVANVKAGSSDPIPVAKADKNSIFFWIGLIVLFVVLMAKGGIN